MNMTAEYSRAREWVKTLSFDLDDKFHTFEVNCLLATRSDGILTNICCIRLLFASLEGFSRRTACRARIPYFWKRPSSWPTGCYPPLTL